MLVESSIRLIGREGGSAAEILKEDRNSLLDQGRDLEDAHPKHSWTFQRCRDLAGFSGLHMLKS